jgi:hypothetical protein
MPPSRRQRMAELQVRIDGAASTAAPMTIQDATGDKLSVRSDGAITVSSIPEGALPYTTLIEDTAVVATANNYLSVFNPLGSGKNVTFAQFTAFPYATAASTATVNMDVWRTTAASGGTLLAAANINKFDTAQTNSVMEVRTANPTCTLLGTLPVLAIPPAITSAGAGVSATVAIIPPSASLFVCHPGEGVVVRMAAGGDVDERWSLGFTWLEI